MNRNGLGGLAAAVLAAFLPAVSASAETLQDALTAAYATNPDLTSTRAGVRVLDERVEQARAEGRPTIDSTVGVTQDFTDIGGFHNDGRAFVANAQIVLPLYQGGRVRNAIRAANERVHSGREDLRGVENQVFTDVVSAYMDVMRDQSVVGLNENNVRVLEEQLRATRDRFEVGDLTRTDVAQSEARLSDARSRLAIARGQLTASREAYRRVVGHAPEALEVPPPLSGLPGTPAQAIDIAVRNNPSLRAAHLNEEAARYDVRVARGSRLPTVTTSTGVRYSDSLGSLRNDLNLPVDDTDTSQTVGVTMNVPLYQGGAAASRIREAQARQSQALEQIVLTERAVVANARNAFEGVVTARSTIESAQTAVAANELALEGARQENLVGTRTILDVLNAEQELLNSRVILVTAQRDEYVAGFALLAVMGRAQAEDLGLPVTRYDPEVNYRRVRGSLSDWDTDPKPTTVATPTADQFTGEAEVTTPQK